MARSITAALTALSLLPAAARAQQALGSVKTEGVAITGTVTVSNGRAVIANTGSIETNAEPADVSLARGGSVRVCRGSSARLAQPAVDVKRPPMLIALDHGGLEIHTKAEKNDIIATPDFRIQISDNAPLHVLIRLVPNGDTCIDNSGKDAPILHATEAFGMAAYFIRPGQRVLFEHGSMREVVDHESSSCGCPQTEPLVLAGKGKRGNGKITEAARNNPFPEAVSQGVQQPTVPQAPADQTHVQVSTTLNYNGTTNTASGPPGEATSAAAGAATDGPPAATTVALSTPPTSPASIGAPSGERAHIEQTAPPPAGPNPFRAIGHFFRRLFGGK